MYSHPASKSILILSFSLGLTLDLILPQTPAALTQQSAVTNSEQRGQALMPQRIFFNYLSSLVQTPNNFYTLTVQTTLSTRQPVQAASKH